MSQTIPPYSCIRPVAMITLKQTVMISRRSCSDQIGGERAKRDICVPCRSEKVAVKS